MIIPEELIDHLESEINIGNVDKKVQNLILIIAEKNKKYKEIIDKIRKEISEEHSIMGVKVVENWVLEDILKEVE